MWNEDREGDRRREAELEEIQKVRYIPGFLWETKEYARRISHFRLRTEGWTEEQIEADDREADARAKEFIEEMERGQEGDITPRAIPGYGGLNLE